MSDSRPHLAAYGYFGMGNLGNEASLAALLARVREARPDVDVSCFGADPVTTGLEHGVPAIRLMTYRPGRPGRSGLGAGALKSLSRVWDVPRTFRQLRDVDVLVVPGMGVLESSLATGPWGLPYWLLVAIVCCRLRGIPVALTSVGVTAPRHPVTRWLFRWSINLADHCTYRDEGSREAARLLGVRGGGGPVVPDLAFGLPAPTAATPRDRHVVVGVMAYEGEPDTPGRGPGLVRSYRDRMTTAIESMVADGRSVTLVVGALSDLGLAHEIACRVRRRPGDPEVEVSAARTQTEVMAEMAAAEVVVASRFHNVLGGLLVGRPTVSLSYARKNEELQARFGLHDFDQPMETFDVDLLMTQVKRASAVPVGTTIAMRATAEGFRRDVNAELDDVLALLGRLK
jgi:polysaccharide pyruvyl transferase WcaK-like protein